MASYPDRLLASRFFAPRNSDVSGIGGPAASKDLGWRKLVWLTVPPNAPAATRGIAAAYLLFNVFQPRAEIGSDPFEPCSRVPARCSANNQVILVPQTVQTGRDALFWLVFENAAARAKRTDHLNASSTRTPHFTAPARKPCSDAAQSREVPGSDPSVPVARIRSAFIGSPRDRHHSDGCPLSTRKQRPPWTSQRRTVPSCPAESARRSSALHSSLRMVYPADRPRWHCRLLTPRGNRRRLPTAMKI